MPLRRANASTPKPHVRTARMGGSILKARRATHSIDDLIARDLMLLRIQPSYERRDRNLSAVDTAAHFRLEARGVKRPGIGDGSPPGSLHPGEMHLYPVPC